MKKIATVYGSLLFISFYLVGFGIVPLWAALLVMVPPIILLISWAIIVYFSNKDKYLREDFEKVGIYIDD